MNIETIFTTLAIIVGISTIFLGVMLFCVDLPVGLLNGILGIIIIIWVCFGTHINGCTCNHCYKKIGTENGIEIVKHTDNNLYYYNETNKEYIQIIQNDGTTYTYDEFIEKQLEQFD